MSDDAAALSAMSSLSPEPIPDPQSESQNQQPARPATKPSESWDVAFVYAFLTRFSNIFASPTWPCNIFQFEAAFLADIPSTEWNPASSSTAPSRKTSRVPTALLTPSGDPPTLVPVVEWFVDFLIKGHIPKPDSKKKGKRNFMLELSDMLLLERSSPLYERWEGFNKLRHAAEGQILNLGWQDRAIMLRSACEWALNSSPYVRGQISAHYNLLPQRVVRRRADENALIIAPIGRDNQKRPFFRLDDTARIYKAGSFYSVNNTWEAVTDNVDDLNKLASSLDSNSSTGKKASAKSPELEKAFKKHIQTEIIPNLGLSEERLRHLSHTYNEDLKAQQRAERQALMQEAAAAAPEPVEAETPSVANGGRRAAAKRVNYKDIEDGRVAMEAAAEAKRSKKRARVSESVDVEEDTNNRRSSRTNKGAAPSRFGNNAPKADLQEELNRRRSSRTSRGARQEEEDPVALVQAYIASQQNGEEATPSAETPMDVDEPVENAKVEEGEGEQSVDGAQPEHGEAQDPSKTQQEQKPIEVASAPVEPVQSTNTSEPVKEEATPAEVQSETAPAASESAAGDAPAPSH